MEILLSREFCESVKPLFGQSLYKKSNLYQKGKKATVWIGTLEHYGLGGAEDMPKLI